MCSQTTGNGEEVLKLNKVQQLKCCNIKLEAYTRRENINIFNLQEIEGETPCDTEELVWAMMDEKMKI